MRSQMKLVVIGFVLKMSLLSVWAADLQTFREAYQKSADAILQKYQPQFAGLQQQYQQSLEALKAQVQGQGDLAKTKAAVAEIARFQKAKSLPAAADAGEISEIKALQAAYLKQYAEFEKEMTGKLGSLAGKYAQALDYLQKELVKAGKLDEATAVQTERTKAQTATKDFAEQLTERNSSSGMSNAATLSDNGGAMIGDYQVVDLSGGPTAETYPVTYARSLADVPGGANSDVYKTTRLLLRRIPKGTFTMGSPKSELGRSGNETQHQVTLSQDFYIGVFEVTQRQWERVTGEWPSHFSNVSCRDMRPVEEVTYNDIRGSGEGADWPVSDRVDSTSFMGRLRARTGKTFDLPTESQWEYACRAGTDTPLNSGKSLTTADASCPNVAEVGRYRFNGGSACAPSVGVEGATAKVAVTCQTRGDCTTCTVTIGNGVWIGSGTTPAVHLIQRVRQVVKTVCFAVAVWITYRLSAGPRAAIRSTRTIATLPADSGLPRSWISRIMVWKVEERLGLRKARKSRTRQ